MRAGFVDMHHLLPLKHYNPYRITNQRWQPPSFSSSIGKPAAVTTSLKSVCWGFRRHVMTKLISRRNKASIGKRTALKLCINKLLCDVHSLKFKTGNRDIGYNHTNVENRGESKLPVHLRCFHCCGHHLYDFSFDWHHSFNFKASDHYHFLNLQWTSASSNPRLWWWCEFSRTLPTTSLFYLGYNDVCFCEIREATDSETIYTEQLHLHPRWVLDTPTMLMSHMWTRWLYIH